MKTVKILIAIAIVALMGSSSKAQNPEKIQVDYHPERTLASTTAMPAETLGEMEYMRNVYELKMIEMRLEHLMYRTERELRYVAPSPEVLDALESLDSLASEMEAKIKYVAPNN